MDLTELFYANGTSKVSQTKFWNSIGFFVATICFVYFNFALPSSGAIEAIWLIYLSVVAGAASLSKYISAKFGSQQNFDSNRDRESSSRSRNYYNSGRSNKNQSIRPDDYED
jgi:hypothetical protein